MVQKIPQKDRLRPLTTISAAEDLSGVVVVDSVEEVAPASQRDPCVQDSVGVEVSAEDGVAQMVDTVVASVETSEEDSGATHMDKTEVAVSEVVVVVLPVVVMVEVLVKVAATGEGTTVEAMEDVELLEDVAEETSMVDSRSEGLHVVHMAALP